VLFFEAMEPHKRPVKKQSSIKRDWREDSLKAGVVKSGYKEFNLDDVLDDEIDQDVLSKKLIDWTPLDVKRWIFNEGFSTFWPFIQNHNPTGIDLLMLNEVGPLIFISLRGSFIHLTIQNVHWHTESTQAGLFL
jgi:hypothetical protein